LEDLETKEEVKVGGKRKEINLLEEYLGQPVPSTVLVFCYKDKKVDGKLNLAKKLKSLPGYFLAEPIKESELTRWIEDYVKAKGFKISSKAAQMLADCLGSDLSKVANEVSKLGLLIKPGEEISYDLVEKNIGISKEFNVFELQKAISNRDVLKAYRITSYFAANKKANSIYMVLGFLYGYFSKVFLYHTAPLPKTDSSLAAAMGISPYIVREYANAAKFFPLQKLPFIFSSLREADTRLKGADGFSLKEEEVYQELLFKIFNG
jgi:DNA polymerase-3 subunit delta